MLVCIDPGHNYGLNGLGKDPGAVNNELGLKESIIALEIATTLGSYLKSEGIECIYTRTNGKELGLMERCRYANGHKADLFISIHLNAADNISANGIETLRYPTKSEKTIRLAKLVQNNLIEATGARDRGVKERPNLCVLKHTDMPAILIEVGFISNREEALKLNDPPYQRKLCTAICDAVVNWRSTYES